MSDIARQDFLFEIGTEEIPARMAPGAMEDLKALFAKEMEALHLDMEKLDTCATPRRLILVARGLPEQQQDRLVERKGPAKAQAYDASGAVTKAAQGFARSAGVEVSDLVVGEFNGIEYLFARKQEKGEPTATLLEAVLPRILSALRFPKSMRWASQKQAFVRPIHWFVAVFGGKVIPFEFAGIQSGNVTRGHRFMGKQQIVVSGPDEYVAQLKANFVIPCPSERRETIRSEAAALAASKGLTVLDSPELLEQVTFLVEYPVVHMGRFDEKFLEMPGEVPVTSMKNHQKFFACMKDGKLSNYFVVVSNTRTKDQAVVSRGNERVLKARLEDGMFFFTDDRSKPLEEYVEKLKGQTFLQGMGSMFDKTLRLESLAGKLADVVAPEAKEQSVRAARLAKADLPTQVVGEFPELQGIMGREYARMSGEAEEVCLAIDEHYMPRFAGDKLPKTKAGTILALADKLDVLACCFALRLIPTATKDPYGLRRAALGITRILGEGKLLVPMSKLVQVAVENLGERAKDPTALTKEILDFVVGRLRNGLVTNHATEVVDAVLATGAEYPYDVEEKVKAVEALRGRPDYETLILPFKRVINIITGRPAGEFDASKMQDLAEKELWTVFSGLEGEIRQALEQRRFDDVLGLFLRLKPPIDAYFDQVLVLCEDEALRLNRVGMLARIGSVFLAFADFTKILV